MFHIKAYTSPLSQKEKSELAQQITGAAALALNLSNDERNAITVNFKTQDQFSTAWGGLLNCDAQNRRTASVRVNGPALSADHYQALAKAITDGMQKVVDNRQQVRVSFETSTVAIGGALSQARETAGRK